MNYTTYTTIFPIYTSPTYFIPIRLWCNTVFLYFLISLYQIGGVGGVIGNSTAEHSPICVHHLPFFEVV